MFLQVILEYIDAQARRRMAGRRIVGRRTVGRRMVGRRMADEHRAFVGIEEVRGRFSAARSREFFEIIRNKEIYLADFNCQFTFFRRKKSYGVYQSVCLSLLANVRRGREIF